jgi:two-component system phosphate regulon response regulator PhoB
MPPKSVLIVEDESDLAELLRYNLEREGYAARSLSDGRLALADIKRQPPDLVILDRMLPGVSGDEIIAQLKREPRTAGVPVIMLTAKAEESDELVGFALGADDYVTKPFSMKLLLARITALFRRAEPAESASDVYTIGPVHLDVSRHEVLVHGAPVVLTATEFRLLRTLIAGGGRVLTRAQIIDNVLGTSPHSARNWATPPRTSRPSAAWGIRSEHPAEMART